MKNILNRTAAMFAVLLGLASCGPNQPEEQTYITALPLELTFDVAKESANIITVKSNSPWTLVADAGLKLDPSKGAAGETEVTVTDVPENASCKATFLTEYYDSAGKRLSTSVTVSRGWGEQTLTVWPTTLVFESSPTFSVESNASWTASCSNAAVKFSPASGKSGSTTVSIGDMPAGTTQSIVIATQPRYTNEPTLSETVAISREAGFTVETVYNEDFGTGATTNSSALSFTGWNTTGTGAATVTYSISSNSQMKNDNYGSSGRYTGASGGNYFRTYYDNGKGFFVVKNITLPTGVLNYTLSLGTEFTPTECIIALSADGKTLSPLTFSAGASYGYWGAVKIDFTLSAPAEKLCIHILPKNATARYGINVDDICLKTSDTAGQTIELKEPTFYRWAELPATVDNSDYAYHTYWTTTVSSQQSVRNFSYCYDTRRHNPIWVAFPIHECYREGGFGRTDPDPWHKADELEQSEQSIIYPIVENGTTYQYWSYDNINSFSWTRGHLCRSADRGGANKEINIQTFVPTNIAPQAHGRFASLWADSEALTSGGGSFTQQICADTLYVVAGCYYANDNTTVDDACAGSDRSSVSKKCVVPTHQFKILLRTRSGSSGKPIQECSTAELRAIGFWFESIIDEDDTRELKDYAMSITEIERLTGMTFYPDIPVEVKGAYTLSDWGL